MKTRKGLALLDIVREVTMFVFKIKMPTGVRIRLLMKWLILNTG
ncbi:Subunit of heteropentameric Replication factor C (RF-C) [Castilleja foliolosa]|uniref:Subunit of heteropentameric Replication factor C (RF-C) n=1 Tax=Castilleja foliolosa TaxID=1961234 RepID=A0ABD3CB32_9LAMI